MKNYKYFTLNDYESYVLLLSNEDIYFLYDQIKKEIKTNKVIVDMFYRNGYTFNRFVELLFLENNMVKTRIINPRLVSENVKQNTSNYFNENKDLLNKSTLPKSVKNFIFCS